MLRFRRTLLAALLLGSGLLVLIVMPAHGRTGINCRIMPLGDSITWGTESTTQNGYRGPLSSALSSQVAAQDFVGTQINGIMSEPGRRVDGRIGHHGCDRPLPVHACTERAESLNFPAE